MVPDQNLADELYREKVLRAREMSPEDKFLAGARLFERTCRIMADGIRQERPTASEEEVQRILAQRLELARQLEAHR